MEKNWQDMSPADIMNTLLGPEKDSFLTRMMRLGVEDGIEYSDVVDALVSRMNPLMSAEGAHDYELDIRIIREYERYIIKEDWENSSRPDFQTDFYNYAFYGIRGYVDRRGLFKQV